MDKNTNQIHHDVVIDVGSAFTKIGVFREVDGKYSLVGFEMLPTTDEGVYLSSPLGKEKPTFEVTDLLSKHTQRHTMVSTSKTKGIRVVAVGYSNSDIEHMLSFSDHMGIEVVGIMTLKSFHWASKKRSSFEHVDAVMFSGGFERKRESKLLGLAALLSREMQSVVGVPILFLGSSEMYEKVRKHFRTDQDIHLVPDLWKDKEYKNFLRLFLEIQEIALQKTINDFPYLSDYQDQVGEIDSGVSSLLSSLSLLTNVWQDNVLLIDIGSEKTCIAWSYASKEERDLQREGKHLSFDYGDEKHFGMKIFSHYGLGGTVEEALREMDESELVDLWPEGDKQKFRDRIFNHAIYSAVIPDNVDLKWQNKIVEKIFKEVFSILPPRYSPDQMILSGSYFGKGARLDSFLTNVLIPSRFPYTTKIWINTVPVLPILGHALKITSSEKYQMSDLLFMMGQYVRFGGKPDKNGVFATVKIETPDDKQSEERSFLVKKGETHVVGLDTDHETIFTVFPTKRARIASFEVGAPVSFEMKNAEKGVFLDGRI